jgi:hypothetical protein
MHTLSHAWYSIQRTLFPFLEEESGPLSAPLKKLVATLELVRIEEFIPPSPVHTPGRPSASRRALARAFVAKAISNLPTTQTLIDTLRNSPALRRICGWERQADIPDESTFSRAFAEFAATMLPQRVHAALIEKYEAPRLVGHISRDGTAIEARERPAHKAPVAPAEKRPKGKPGRPKKGEVRPPKPPTRLERQVAGMSLEAMLSELPTACDVGCKKNSKGNKEYWIGYKLHLDWADGEIPVSCALTSASVHDSQVAIPLATMTSRRVTNLYDLMDSAYDAVPIWAYSRSLGHVPIIDRNCHGADLPGFDPAEAVRFKERSTAERGNARLKDEFGGRFVRVRGNVKVMAHLMFGVIALTADQLLRLVV